MIIIHDKKILGVLISILLGLFLGWLLVFRLVLPGMWNFLLVDESPRPSDVIIVLSGDTGRLEYGIELYQLGYANNILFAGGAAQSMKRQAISMGITESQILTDRASHSTFQNARNSAMIMQDHELQSAIIVTSGYHTKRASIIFSQFLPRSELTICAVPDGATSHNWWKDGHTVTAVVLEYLKFIWHILFER